jgi:hypothetical protein
MVALDRSIDRRRVPAAGIGRGQRRQGRRWGRVARRHAEALQVVVHHLGEEGVGEGARMAIARDLEGAHAVLAHLRIGSTSPIRLNAPRSASASDTRRERSSLWRTSAGFSSAITIHIRRPTSATASATTTDSTTSTRLKTSFLAVIFN